MTDTQKQKSIQEILDHWRANGGSTEEILEKAYDRGRRDEYVAQNTKTTETEPPHAA